MKQFLILFFLSASVEGYAQDNEMNYDTSMVKFGEWKLTDRMMTISYQTFNICDSSGIVAYKDSCGWHYKDANKVIECLIKLNTAANKRENDLYRDNERLSELIRVMCRRISTYDIFKPQ